MTGQARLYIPSGIQTILYIVITQLVITCNNAKSNDRMKGLWRKGLARLPLIQAIVPRKACQVTFDSRQNCRMFMRIAVRLNAVQVNKARGRGSRLLWLVNLDRSTSPTKNATKGLIVCHV